MKMGTLTDFDIIVIGGGHAGIEAALAGARMGCRTAMITMSRDAIGRMSCNPAIGGLAKGQLVKEIDALGGEMGYATDLAGIQFRMLNRSKGPAVQSRRAQCDRALYSAVMIGAVSTQQGLEIIEGEVTDLTIHNMTCFGVALANGERIESGMVVITAGTFLNGLIYRGLERIPAGRVGEAPAIGLSRRLQELGLQTGRLKTGTPPRLDGKTIDFSKCEVQPGDIPPPFFSNRSDHWRKIDQISCYLTYTNEKTHGLIRDNLHLSPMFSGAIKGIGPRYCPSIEDKVVRFSDRDRHQLFLEPEGLNTDEYYLNGFSSSLPANVQLETLHTITGLEEVVMTRPGYAIEYDFFPPHQVFVTMESKLIPNLFFAGQVNGTSGYEEAAAQGIIAGINAALKVKREPPFRLSRSAAYIGVLIDDLVTKSTSEPYRMFTSRAEYRLNLRDDNAEERLLEQGYSLGLVKQHAYQKYCGKQDSKREMVERLKMSRIRVPVNENGNGSHRVLTAHEALRNPDIKLDSYPIYEEIGAKHGSELFQRVLNDIRYEGYILRQDKRVERFRQLENLPIPPNINFEQLRGLKKEAAQKLTRFRPETLGQASRISGVTPGDMTVLLVHFHR
jgi:tRNA uridine 5-carboxymethylaminomethyl modification enzyme